MTTTEILKICQDENVDFVRLQFTDIFGFLKNVAITTRQLPKVLENGCMFDGSSIEGFARIEESDMILKPDVSTFAIFPFENAPGKIARLICDVYKTDGTPFEGDPRYVLKKVLNSALEMGYECNVGPECEFFLFDLDANGVPTVNTKDKCGYLEISAEDSGSVCRREICLALEKMGYYIEASHHENAHAQHEIDFKYSKALKAADDIMTFKLVVKAIARKYNLHATFMPKPKYGEAGNGMHINLSLSKNGENIFYDNADKLGLSSIAYGFIGGIMQNIKGISAIANPLVNSYKRLVSGYEAPIYIAWSACNRSPLIRIPAARGQGSRVEVRSPDPSCNPYLALATIIASGLKGVQEKIVPPQSVNTNIFEMSEQERQAKGVDSLPASLSDALKELKNNKFVLDVLGKHIADIYIPAKRAEWISYRTAVSAWEVDNYLEKY